MNIENVSLKINHTGGSSMRKTAILIITAFMLLTACSKKNDVQPTQTTPLVTSEQQQTPKNKPSEPIKEEKSSEPIYLSDLQYDKMDGTYKKGIISFNNNDYGGKLQVTATLIQKGFPQD
jgi:major membrane immunogen (membrane-anchored lipoprotein)